MASRNNAWRNRDVRCLVSYLGCFSDDDEGFEHPVEFYDEDSTVGEGDKDSSKGEQPTRFRNRRCWLIAAIAIMLLLLVVLVSTLTTKERRSSKRSASALNQDDCGRRQRRLGTLDNNNNLPPWTLETVRRLEMEVADAVSIGCFRVETSPDNRTVTASTLVDRVQACDTACSTHYFALASSDNDNFKDDDDTVTCYCYVERPTERLSIGPCHKIDVVYDICDDESTKRQEMEVFFDPHWGEICNQGTTSTVRNFLVEEDDVPFGFDIITSEFRPSPFELYKDECGTNMYEVQTEVCLFARVYVRQVFLDGFVKRPDCSHRCLHLLQVSGGNRKLTTEVSTVEEDALRRRGDLAGTIYGSRVGGYDPLLSTGTVVAGLADSRQTSMFRSSGAQEAGSSVFTSSGVKRLAEVKIVDFENKRDFVTFNREFGALLRSYRQSGFARSTAQQIFRTYGMFVVTRGVFGGYLELRSTMLASDVENLFSEREAARLCYESFASVRAGNYGFYGNTPTGVDGCGQDAMDAFEASRRAYELDTSEADVVGGNAGEKDLEISPATSTLLTSSDMYPFGDNGLELRPLTDFLSPRVISPMEIKRYQMTEDEFAEIQENLQTHLQEELSGVQEVLGQCGDCEVPYLVQLSDSWGFDCTCYEPVPQAPVHEPAPALPVFSSIAGTYEVQIRRRGENYWGVGAHNQGTLEISAEGDVTYNGLEVTEYEYDEDRKFLSWDEHGDIVSRADITFYMVKDDQSFFGDQPESEGANVFMGVIDDGWFAADEIRGFRQEEEN